MAYHIFFEWNEDDFYQGSAGISRLPTPDVVAEKSEAALQGTLNLIQDIGARVNQTVNQMQQPPSEVELEFGIRLGAESGVITKSHETAHFVVHLKWRA